MTPQEFVEFRARLDAESSDIMGLANQEYAATGDKFFNFRQVAEIIGQHPALKDVSLEDMTYIVACIYYLKHVFSIVRGVSHREDMRGRHIDARNYTDLLAGIWHESHRLTEAVPSDRDETARQAQQKKLKDCLKRYGPNKAIPMPPEQYRG